MVVSTFFSIILINLFYNSYMPYLFLGSLYTKNWGIYIIGPYKKLGPW